MNRPTRQRNHLLQKVSAKQSRGHKKPGRKTKRWNKWIQQYAPIAGGTEAAAAS